MMSIVNAGNNEHRGEAKTKECDCVLNQLTMIQKIVYNSKNKDRGICWDLIGRLYLLDTRIRILSFKERTCLIFIFLGGKT